MVAITLKDGSVRRFDGPVAGSEIARAIGPRLAKDALAITVDGEMKDLAHVVPRDAKVEIVTREDPRALELLRHDAAHVMAEAVQELYPGTQVTFGPATETGFYYDFARDEPFTPEDLEKIEARMHEIVRRDEPIERSVLPREEAIRFFANQGEKYKAEHIENLPEEEEISLYGQGGFMDLCTGPHLPSTGKLGHGFKLMKLAGAYWRGDPKNDQLQRIYGTAWPDEKQLHAFLHQLEEAEKRDHRRLGREMDLFHQQEEAVGSVFWHPKGWTLWRTLEEYMRRRLEAAGYVEVQDPATARPQPMGSIGPLGEVPRGDVHGRVGGQEVLALKPMNCPCHVQISPGHQELSRSAVAHGRVRLLPSQRAVRRAAWPHARARLHSGRCAYLLHRGPDHRRDEDFCDLLLSVYRDLGFDEVTCDSPIGRRAAPARTRSGTRPKPR